MAKTTPMKLVELMVLNDDIQKVIEYLGKKASFQFQLTQDENSSSQQVNPYLDYFERLEKNRVYLNLPQPDGHFENAVLPSEEESKRAWEIIQSVDELQAKETEALEAKTKAQEAYEEGKAFANLKVEYSQIDHLSFLTLRIGKIESSVIDELSFALGGRAAIIPLGEDKTHIMAVASKKSAVALDTELKRFGFVQLEIPEDFKGMPQEMLDGLQKSVELSEEKLKTIQEEKANFAETHADLIKEYLCDFSLASQIQLVQNKLESTQLVYRIAGWVSSDDARILMKDLDDMTQGRIAIRQYDPAEVPSVQNGHEKVPVKLSHGKVVKSFERMVFSYGSPLYGTIDPTPFVAFFFSLLYGIMFGDLGQGLVFVLLGILLTKHWIPWFKSWHKFGPVFISIGIMSCIMGLLTGEFFCNETLLEPWAMWVTGLFGESHAPILHMMPSANTMGKMFMFFLFTIGVGFIINSIGLVINIVNNFMLHRYGKAIFGKTGICGTVFFWYVVAMVIRIFALKGSIHVYDWIVIALALLGVFFAEPLERLVEGERPVFENGVFAALIAGLVELIEVLSTYISNSVSFLRVGAFAMAHAVLGYIVFTMMSIVPNFAGSLAVQILGNLIIIVLEGMIVAIQVVRLQYYEFFSKFFTETGREFEPFQFKYRDN